MVLCASSQLFLRVNKIGMSARNVQVVRQLHPAELGERLLRRQFHADLVLLERSCSMGRLEDEQGFYMGFHPSSMPYIRPALPLNDVMPFSACGDNIVLVLPNLVHPPLMQFHRVAH